MVASIWDAWPVGLMLGDATRVGARNGFAETRD
jgi:hypothetical protein